MFIEEIERAASVGVWRADLEEMVTVAVSTGPENLGWGSEGSCAATHPHPTTCMLRTSLPQKPYDSLLFGHQGKPAAHVTGDPANSAETKQTACSIVEAISCKPTGGEL